MKIEHEHANVIEAASSGASQGVSLAINIVGMLIAFIALVSLFNGLLGWVGTFIGFPAAGAGVDPATTLSLQWLFSKVLWPLAWVMGVPSVDCSKVARLIGFKTVINEFVAYAEMTKIPMSEWTEKGAPHRLLRALRLRELLVDRHPDRRHRGPRAVAQERHRAPRPLGAPRRVARHVHERHDRRHPPRLSGRRERWTLASPRPSSSSGQRIPVPPVVGVILGSGLGDFAAAVEDRLEIPYAQIPGFPASAVVGHAGTLVAGTLAGVPIVVLSGRIHFYEGHPMSAVVTPARVLGLLGCRDVVVTNAAGGIDRAFSAGRPDAHLRPRQPVRDEPAHRAERRDVRSRASPTCPTPTAPTCGTLAKAVARRVRVPLKEGVYVGVTGPSYETPAEIRAFRALGAHAVGMSTVPEVIALNHMGVGVVGISCITNMAAGVLKKPLLHDEVLETTRRVKDRFVRLLTALVAAMGEGRSPDRLVVVPARKATRRSAKAKPPSTPPRRPGRRRRPPRAGEVMPWPRSS